MIYEPFEFEDREVSKYDGVDVVVITRHKGWARATVAEWRAFLAELPDDATVGAEAVEEYDLCVPYIVVHTAPTADDLAEFEVKAEASRAAEVERIKRLAAKHGLVVGKAAPS